MSYTKENKDWWIKNVPKERKKGSTNADVPLFAPRKIDRFNQSNTTE
jgi:hypothetical protein